MIGFCKQMEKLGYNPMDWENKPKKREPLTTNKEIDDVTDEEQEIEKELNAAKEKLQKKLWRK